MRLVGVLNGGGGRRGSHTYMGEGGHLISALKPPGSLIA